MDRDKLKDLLYNVRLGDYVLIKYQTFFLKKQREIRGYVTKVDIMGISLDDADPFVEEGHAIDEDFHFRDILEFKKLKESSFSGLGSKIVDEEI